MSPKIINYKWIHRKPKKFLREKDYKSQIVYKDKEFFENQHFIGRKQADTSAPLQTLLISYKGGKLIQKAGPKPKKAGLTAKDDNQQRTAQTLIKNGRLVFPWILEFFLLSNSFHFEPFLMKMATVIVLCLPHH